MVRAEQVVEGVVVDEAAPVEDADFIEAEIIPTPGPFAAGMIKAVDTYAEEIVLGIARAIDERLQ